MCLTVDNKCDKLSHLTKTAARQRKTKMQTVNVAFTIDNGNLRHTVIRLSLGSRQAAINEAMTTIATIWNVVEDQVTIVKLT